MKNLTNGNRYSKTVSGVFLLFYVFLMSFVSCQAADFVRLEIYPQNVGVFTVNGTQQFVAFGRAGNGSVENITNKVLWKSSNTELVTIDGNGLATIKAGVTAGQVKISCTYPKNITVTPIIGSILRPSYTVTASVDDTSDFGDIAPEGEALVKSRKTLVLDLTPANSYEVVASGVGGTCPKGSVIANYTQYRTGAIVEDCSVIIPFTSKPEITPSVGSGSGTITPDNATPVFTGANQAFILTPGDGSYSATSVTGTCPSGTLTYNDPVPNSSTYATGPIAGDCTVIAQFTENPVIVTAQVNGGNGTVSPDGAFPYVSGDTAEFTLVPSPGYAASLVSDTCVDGGAFSNNFGTYTTALLTADCAVAFQFVPTSSTLTVSVVGDGGVHTGDLDPAEDIFCYEQDPENDPDGCTHVYNSGDEIILHAQENILSGSSFDGWTGCDSVNDNDCTVTMDSDKTITATFSN